MSTFGTTDPGEKVEDIKLVIIEKEDQLIGATIEHKFFDKNIAHVAIIITKNTR